MKYCVNVEVFDRARVIVNEGFGCDDPRVAATFFEALAVRLRKIEDGPDPLRSTRNTPRED